MADRNDVTAIAGIYQTFYKGFSHGKGQYGINTGGEIGLYYADDIVPESRWEDTLFHSVGIFLS